MLDTEAITFKEGFFFQTPQKSPELLHLPSFETSPSPLPMGVSTASSVLIDSTARFECALNLSPTYAIVSSCISFYIPCFIMVVLYWRLYQKVLSGEMNTTRASNQESVGKTSGLLRKVYLSYNYIQLKCTMSAANLTRRKKSTFWVVVCFWPLHTVVCCPIPITILSADIINCLFLQAMHHVRTIKQMTRPLRLGSVNGKSYPAPSYPVSEHKAAITVGEISEVTFRIYFSPIPS